MYLKGCIVVIGLTASEESVIEPFCCYGKQRSVDLDRTSRSDLGVHALRVFIFGDTRSNITKTRL